MFDVSSCCVSETEVARTLTLPMFFVNIYHIANTCLAAVTR